MIRPVFPVFEGECDATMLFAILWIYCSVSIPVGGIRFNGPAGRYKRGMALRMPVIQGAHGTQVLIKLTVTTSIQLEVAWSWKSDNYGNPEFKSETTPLMVDGMLYFTAGNRRNVLAIDAGSGETLWMWADG